VRPEIKDMLDDALTQIEYSSYPEEEICVRLHHRMVKTHCFTTVHPHIYKEEAQFWTYPAVWGASKLMA
jgi:hypothetical protein